MSWVKFYIIGLLVSLIIFTYYLFKFTHLMNKICLYLRDNYNEFFKEHNLSVVEELADIFKARPVPVSEYFKEPKLLFSEKILFDEKLTTMQKYMKRNFYLTLIFITLFILLGFSGKFIIKWAGS